MSGTATLEKQPASMEYISPPDSPSVELPEISEAQGLDSMNLPTFSTVLVPGVGAPTFTQNYASLSKLVNDPKTFTRLLKNIVAKSGLTKAEIARRLGIRENGFRQYFSGNRSNPSVRWFIRLCDICGAEITVKFREGK